MRYRTLAYSRIRKNSDGLLNSYEFSYGLVRTSKTGAIHRSLVMAPQVAGGLMTYIKISPQVISHQQRSALFLSGQLCHRVIQFQSLLSAVLHIEAHAESEKHGVCQKLSTGKSRFDNPGNRIRVSHVDQNWLPQSAVFSHFCDLSFLIANQTLEASVLSHTRPHTHAQCGQFRLCHRVTQWGVLWWASPKRKGPASYNAGPLVFVSRRNLRCGHFATVGDNHLSAGPTAVGTHGFDCLHDVHTFYHGTEDHVLAVQPCRLDGAQEELRTIGVRTGVGHAQNASSGMLQLEVFVSELRAVDRLSACPVMIGKVTALAHEIRDDSVKCRTLVTETLFTRAQSTEVFGRLWHHVRSQFNHDSTGWLVANRNVHETTWQLLFFCAHNNPLMPEKANDEKRQDI